jgi:hypothetical protein
VRRAPATPWAHEDYLIRTIIIIIISTIIITTTIIIIIIIIIITIIIIIITPHQTHTNGTSHKGYHTKRQRQRG